jgi:hypothetical protein
MASARVSHEELEENLHEVLYSAGQIGSGLCMEIPLIQTLEFPRNGDVPAYRITVTIDVVVKA